MTMVYALLAPEAITAWALRQRLAARKIVDMYNEEVVTDTSQAMNKSTTILGTIQAIFQDSSPTPSRKDGDVPRWTLARGFFLQMGGFMLCKGGNPKQTLRYKRTGYFGSDNITNIRWCILHDIIDPPLTKEEDIKDPSKGDTISKTLIIVQTTWFIAQCIARWSSHLLVTELEVVTLGFAILNGITYGLWWHKPQSVGWPVFLEMKRETPQGRSDNSGTSPINNPSYLWRKVHEDFESYTSPKCWKFLYLTPLHFFQSLLRPLSKLADYYPLLRGIEQGDLRIPTFYSYSTHDMDSAIYRMTGIIGVLFGSVHLIPSWFLDFASVQEKWLWRGSAFVITVGPVFLGFAEFDRDSTAENTSGYLLIMTLPLYIICRVILLVLSLTSLRSLPPAALQTIEWTTFIPHI